MKTTEQAIHEAAINVLDQITAQNTAFPTFAKLIEAEGGYRPTIITSQGTQLHMLALAYNKTQLLRGDSRRVNLRITQ